MLLADKTSVTSYKLKQIAKDCWQPLMALITVHHALDTYMMQR